MTPAVLVVLLAAVADVRQCGTPERLASFQLGARFSRPPVGQVVRRVNNCTIHYDTTGRHRTTHEYADSAVLYAERAWLRQVGYNGWAAPPPDGQGPDATLDIYLEDTTAWAGLTSPEDQYDEPYPDGWSSFIEIATRMGWPKLENVVAHEFNHACQFRYSGVEGGWFYENTAEWMGDRATEGLGFGAWWLNGYRHPLDSTHYRLSRFTYPGWLWPRFLQEYFADTLCPRRVWEQLGVESGENTYWGTWVALFEHYDASLEQALGHYAIWRWFTGSRDDGRHFGDAEDWQTSRCYHWHSQYPVTDSATDRFPEAPGGCKYVGFTGFGGNRLRLFFDGEDGRGWNVYALGLGSIPREYRILLPNSADTGSVVVPGWQYDTIVLVAAATQVVETPGLRFSWRATLEGDSAGLQELDRTMTGPALRARFAHQGVAFRYVLPVGRAGTLVVYDASGRRVVSFDVRGTGRYAELLWRDPRARGTYLCRLNAGDLSQTVKFVRAKE